MSLAIAMAFSSMQVIYASGERGLLEGVDIEDVTISETSEGTYIIPNEPVEVENVDLLINNDEMYEDLEEDFKVIDTIELEHGVMYTEVTNDYRLAYIIYEDGFVEYSITQNDKVRDVFQGTIENVTELENEGTEESGNLRSIGAFDINESIKSIVLDEFENVNAEDLRTFEDVTNVYSRAYTGSVSEAKDMVYGLPDYKSPGDRWLGSLSRGVVADLYESATLYAYKSSVVRYYAGDTLTSVAVAVGTRKPVAITKAIYSIYKAGKGYVAERNGSLAYYVVENPKTKYVRIKNGTWYNAGSDADFGVFFGDYRHSEIEWKYAHPDYNNSNSYFLNKALDNYYAW